jgi:hypothetical protein
VTVGELIDRIEKAGFVMTGDKTLAGFPPGILEGQILTAPMVLIPDPYDVAEETSTMVPNILDWDGWDRLNEFKRIDGAAATTAGVMIHLQFVERNWLVNHHLDDALEV